MRPLPLIFYQKSDVVLIARELIGKKLFTCTLGEKITGGIITETEAYAGPQDRASHAYGNRRTKRTEIMFAEGGVAYVYLCYGIHNLLNIVTNEKGIPHAVLIRAIIPTCGIELILQRRKKIHPTATLTNGPGSVCQALGIGLHHNGSSLTGPPLWIEDSDFPIDSNKIVASPRIGIDYAGEDALLPWGFLYTQPNNLKN